MPPSYRLVNFRLRPAKAVERKMIVEVCGRMSAFSNILAFRYIGLGSPFFNDFTMLHRRYGIKNLICIEREVQHQTRFLFNRPFDCIEMEWGESSDVLPMLPWAGIPSIVWMDYDDKLSDSMLADIRTIFSQIETGSLAIFTIQATGNSFGDDEYSPNDEKRSPLEDFRDQLKEFVPTDVSDRDMRGKAFQKLVWRIVDNEISRVLDQRNAAMPAQNQVLYKQLFNVMYADDVRMTTIGGIVYRADQEQRLATCEFADFEFLRYGDEPLEIKVPSLTHREQWKLDTRLPSGQPTLDFLAPSDISEYGKIYRYYPMFVETDL